MTTSWLIFSKALDYKESKTRLRKAQQFSEEFIDRLHHAFIRDTFEVAIHAEVEHRFAAWYPSPSLEGIKDLSGLENASFRHFAQSGTTFGERFESAIDHTFASAQGNVLITGTDCPLLSPALIHEAKKELECGKVVLGPSSRGGFYLLGVPYAFRHVRFKDCFRQGLESLQVISALEGAPVYLLPHLNDIDLEEDLISLKVWLQLAKLHTISNSDSTLYLPKHTTKLLEEIQLKEP